MGGKREPSGIALQETGSRPARGRSPGKPRSKRGQGAARQDSTPATSKRPRGADRQSRKRTAAEESGAPSSKAGSSPAKILIPEVIPPGSAEDRDLREFLDEAAKRIRDKHDAFLRSARVAIRHALSAGRELIAVKKRLPHGEFEKWVQANCPFSTRTARAYMRLAHHEAILSLEHDPKRRPAADLTIRQLLTRLAKPKPRAQEKDDSAGSDAEASSQDSARDHSESDSATSRQGSARNRGEPAHGANDQRAQSDTDDSVEEAQADHRETAESGNGSGTDQDGVDETDASSPAQAGSRAGSPDEADTEVQDPDEEWLEALPVRRRLTYPGAFDSDALARVLAPGPRGARSRSGARAGAARRPARHRPGDSRRRAAKGRRRAARAQ